MVYREKWKGGKKRLFTKLALVSETFAVVKALDSSWVSAEASKVHNESTCAPTLHRITYTEGNSASLTHVNKTRLFTCSLLYDRQSSGKKSSHKTLNCGHNVEYCVHVTTFIAIFLFLGLSEAEFYPATHTQHMNQSSLSATES